MRKLIPIILMLAILGLGSGALEYWHNLDHAASGKSHDENDCPTHAILRAPVVLDSAGPVVCCVGAVSSPVILVSVSLVSQHAPLRIDCRGPPVW